MFVPKLTTMHRHLLACSLSALWAATSVQATAQTTTAPNRDQQPPKVMKHSDTSARPFDNPQRFARSFDDPSRDAWQRPDVVVAALAPQPGELIADIGAGTGYFSVRLAKAQPGATIFAADIEPSMVDHITQRAADEGLRNIIAVQAAEQSPNLPQAVDLVLVAHTYHHLPNRVAYFKGLHKSLRPGARLAIVEFDPGAAQAPPPGMRVTFEQIESELREAGYRFDVRYDTLPQQQFLIFRPGPQR